MPGASSGPKRTAQSPPLSLQLGMSPGSGRKGSAKRRLGCEVIAGTVKNSEQDGNTPYDPEGPVEAA